LGDREEQFFLRLGRNSLSEFLVFFMTGAQE
jgi:hypothetical protein